MRYILLIADGCADRPVGALGGKTPLESLDLPGCAVLAGGLIGLARTVPIGVKPGSDTAILTIFGNDVKASYTGRAALEAAGANVELKPGETAFRVNLCTIEPASDSDADKSFIGSMMISHNGCGIEGSDALDLIGALTADAGFAGMMERIGFVIHPSPTFRQIGVLNGADETPFDLAEPHGILGLPIAEHLPKGNRADDLAKLMVESHRVLRAHPINISRGSRAANCIWPWAAGRAMSLPNFEQLHQHYGAVVTAVPLLKGIARMHGLFAPEVPGATGDINTNYEGKLNAMLENFREGADFAVLHVEAPDECSHAKDVEGKLESLRRFDRLIVQPMLNAMPTIDPEFRVLLLSDHLTLLENGAHDGAPVPFAIYDSRKPGEPERFCEENARQGCFVADGSKLIELLFERDFGKNILQ
jgi:2,3-bisphosphoglycerate-independent phosphoglycerate mutase